MMRSIPQTLAIAFDGGIARPLNCNDVHPGYVDGLNDAAVNRFLVTVREREQTLESVMDFVRRSIEKDNEILFGIWAQDGTLHCGTIRIHGIEERFHTAMIGVCIFDGQARGRGLGSKAIRAVTQWAHIDLKLRWIEAGTYAENVASQKAFVRAGYEWVFDIPDKYLFEGKTARVKVYASRASSLAAI